VAPAGRTLVVYCEDERYEVNKDQFVIGRGKKATDMTIKDPNVSRTHAMIERVEGQFFMVDMGSTNGVLFKGQRVTRQPISGGDVYRIVKYDLRFEYE
jgi:pSer/pThr/pTyr-binding forkhead associated (FHA) protein